MFFTLIWPYDASRRLIRDGGAETWFWIHVAQALICGVLGLLAFCRLKSQVQREAMPAYLTMRWSERLAALVPHFP